MIIFLIVVIGLVIWSLHLMQQAVAYREFSLMLAGTLVAIAAAGVMVVYFLMGSYMGYMTQGSYPPALTEVPADMLIESTSTVNQDDQTSWKPFALKSDAAQDIL